MFTLFMDIHKLWNPEVKKLDALLKDKTSKLSRLEINRKGKKILMFPKQLYDKHYNTYYNIFNLKTVKNTKIKKQS